MKAHLKSLLLSLPLLSLAVGCAGAADEDADLGESSEEALTAALPQAVYDCTVQNREQVPGRALPYHTLVVPQGKKAVLEATRTVNRTRDSRGNYYGTSTDPELSEDATITKAGKLVTVQGNGYRVTIDTGAKVASPYGGFSYKGTQVEGTKTFNMSCRALSQKDWFDENVRGSNKPSDYIHADVIRLNQVPVALRPKLEAANKAIDADAAANDANLSPGGRYFAVYYTSSKKTPAGYAVWAGDREGANGEIERVYWVVGFSLSGKEVLREMAGLGG